MKIVPYFIHEGIFRSEASIAMKWHITFFSIHMIRLAGWIPGHTRGYEFFLHIFPFLLKLEIFTGRVKDE